jgi:two-component system, NtrC family, sensor histidine kinase KinB
MIVSDTEAGRRCAPGGPSRARSESGTRARILVVDDDDAARSALEKLLREDGFAIRTARDGAEALAEAERALPDVVLTDLQMHPVPGVEVCRRLHAIEPDLPIIVMTAFSDREVVTESLRAGADDYLIKPLQYEAVLWCVERAIARRKARSEYEALYRSFNERLVLSSLREQEHAEAEALHRAHVSALLENLSEGVVIASPSGRVLMVNDAAREILAVGTAGIPTIDALNALAAAYDLEGRPLADAQRPIMRALRGERFTGYEVLRARPSGEQRRLTTTGASVTAENGDVALGIVVLRDVTELRHLEQQRDEYLALISHDLRGPLSNIMLAISAVGQSLIRDGGPATTVKLVDRADRNVRRMTAMLEELTEATSLEAPGALLKLEPCNLREVLTDVVETLGDENARRIRLEADEAPHLVRADAARLERVVANLLSNALKYSADDTAVTVRLLREEGAVVLDVVDRGIGIAPDAAKEVFERYYRTRTAKTKASGLGLGLYIARLIVEAHGGRIEVSSEVGKGSTFRLSLPAG